MTSHVVVLDSRARRAVVKVTPTKHLSDVLGEACGKFAIDPIQYGLKHQKKQLDLSLSFRYSGLSSGAKLELVQLSRSPSVVSVALQLPESEAQGIPNGRITDKFPSNTTLWLILRKFESGVAGNGTTLNITARGSPQATSGESGAGRLFYQTPVIQIMGRALSSFADLQKTLGQLGLNNGSALLRLSFMTTDRPLEEAVAEIDAYFNSVDAKESKAVSAESTPLQVNTPVSSEDTSKSNHEPTPSSTEESSSNNEPLTTPQQIPPLTSDQTPPQPTIVSSRTATIFAPPSNTTPQSARTPYNEKDYVPTVDHARSHQRQLNVASRPTRLAGDAELAEQESALKEKFAKVTEVEVKIRFPDQSQIVSKFTREDSAQTLYNFVRSCLDAHLVDEKFFLSYFPSTAASGGSLATSNSQATVPETPEKLLIGNLHMNGRVLVNFTWNDNAALTARGSGGPVLRPDLRKVASEIKVEDMSKMGVEEEEEKNKSWLQKMGAGGSEQGRSGGKKGGVPKWLKLPGKK